MELISFYKIMGETPSKKNSRQVFRGGKNIPSKKYLMWLKRAEIEILRQGISVPAVSCPIEIFFTFHHEDERTRDTDNQISSILDLLKGIKVISDDNWKIVRRITAEAVKDDKSYVEVIIYKYEKKKAVQGKQTKPAQPNEGVNLMSPVAEGKEVGQPNRYANNIGFSSQKVKNK